MTSSLYQCLLDHGCRGCCGNEVLILVHAFLGSCFPVQKPRGSSLTSGSLLFNVYFTNKSIKGVGFCREWGTFLLCSQPRAHNVTLMLLISSPNTAALSAPSSSATLHLLTMLSSSNRSFSCLSTLSCCMTEKEQQAVTVPQPECYAILKISSTKTFSPRFFKPVSFRFSGHRESEAVVVARIQHE